MGGKYSAVAGMVTGFFTIATFFVGTVASEVTGLLTFLASNLIHVGRFLMVKTHHKQQLTPKGATRV